VNVATWSNVHCEFEGTVKMRRFPLNLPIELFVIQAGITSE